MGNIEKNLLLWSQFDKLKCEFVMRPQRDRKKRREDAIFIDPRGHQAQRHVSRAVCNKAAAIHKQQLFLLYRGD